MNSIDKNSAFERPWHRFYPEGLAASESYPNWPLWSLLADSARRFPDRVALTAQDTEWRYHELFDACVFSAVKFQGILESQHKDRDPQRVLLWLNNSVDFVIAYFAVLIAGDIVSCVSPSMSDEEFLTQFKDVDPGLVIAEKDLLIRARQVLPTFGPALVSIKDVVVHKPEQFPSTKHEVTRRNFSAIEVSNRPEQDFSQTVAVLQYTSGTTGRPKGAMMSHANLLANAVQNARWFGWNEEDSFLCALPLCHTWGMSCAMLSTLSVGARLILPPVPKRFNPEEVFRWIENERATLLYGSATMMYRMLDHPNRAKYDLSSLRVVKAGAMLTQGDLKTRWDELYLNAPLQQGYGLTEASPECHNNPPNAFRVGTVGVPIQDTDCRIVSLNDPNQPLPAGETGEVALKGPQIFLGYWRNPRPSSEAFADGWLLTGDIGHMDEDGYLTIVDRKKDLIKFRGFSVNPSSVEKVLLQHPEVREAVVTSMPDREDGEHVVAFIVPRTQQITEESLVTHCTDQLARYEIPRHWIFEGELPRNSMGKALRRELRDRLRQQPHSQ